MPKQRHVRLFRNGRSQAVSIPMEFELPGSEAIVHRDGDRLVIEPARKRGLYLTQDDEAAGRGFSGNRRSGADAVERAVTLWLPDQEASSGDSYFKMAERAVADLATMP